jgi:hypothetical protein
MKATPISILIYGSDAYLLETHQWAFQTRGYRVLTIMQLADLRTIPLAQPVALLVLCHALTSAERAAAIALASSRWPGIKSLVLMPDILTVPTQVLGQLCGSMNGPTPLFSIVSEIVGQGRGTPIPLSIHARSTENPGRPKLSTAAI